MKKSNWHDWLAKWTAQLGVSEYSESSNPGLQVISGAGHFICPINRYGVDTPKKGGASVSRHEFVMHRLAFGWSNPKDRPGLRPPASTTSRKRAGDEGFSSCTQDLCGRPKATQRSRTQTGNPRNPDRESGPIPGGWAGPTNPLGDRLPAGRV